jgi:hypothetical protein
VGTTPPNPKADLKKRLLISPQELERNRIWYEERLAKLGQVNSPLFIEAVRISELLSEPNTLVSHQVVLRKRRRRW